MSLPPALSIIIPTRNAPLIGVVCRSVHAQLPAPGRDEILVVGEDDAGLIPRLPGLRHLPAPRGWHAAAKRNLAMDAARGDLFFFIDADCLPAADWLAAHLARHGQGEQIVGGAVAPARDTHLQLADNLSAFHELLPETRAGSRPYLATANLSVRRAVVRRAGPLPDLARAHDLAWTARMGQLGYRLYFEPSARVFHDPARHAWDAVLAHWVEDAPDTLRVRLAFADQLGTPMLARRRWPFLWLAPLIAVWATARVFRRPVTLYRYWWVLPQVVVTKLAWCLSAYRAHPVRTGRWEVP